MTVRIAPAGVADLPGMAEVDGDSFERAWSLPAFEAEWANVGRFVGLHVARADGTVVGFLIVHRAEEEAEVVRIAVDPAWRRTGIGSRLLRSWLDTVPGVRVFLEVRSDDAGAIAFYARHGFAVVGRRKGYYATAEGPVDATRMARSAPP